MLQLSPKEWKNLITVRDRRQHKGIVYVLTAFGDESSDETHQRVFAVGAVFGEQHQKVPRLGASQMKFTLQVRQAMSR
jgi:hypothetical protein